MTPKELASFVRFKTNTDSTTFPDTEIKMLANIYIDEFATEIAKINEDIFGVPQTTDLLLNTREYPLPTDILNNIKMVEAKLDGSKFIRLKEFDLNQYQRTTDETTILSYFSNTEGHACYDLFRNSLWLYTGAVTAVVGGLKLWAFSFPAHLTDLTVETDMAVDPSTTSHGMPRQFHRLLATKICIAKKSQGDTPVKLDAEEANFPIDFKKAIEATSGMNLDRANVATPKDRTNEHDNGYNY